MGGGLGTKMDSVTENKRAKVGNILMNNPVLRHLMQVEEKSIDVRGRFLAQAIRIESVIEDIISCHFCPDEDKSRLFRSLIMNNTDFTFSSKIKILEKLLKKYYADLFDRYPKIINDANKIRRFRNKIAHTDLDLSQKVWAERRSDRIRLVYYEDGERKEQIVTDAEIEKRLENCYQLFQALFSISLAVLGRVSANIDNEK